MTGLADVRCDRFKICIQDCILPDFQPLSTSHDVCILNWLFGDLFFIKLRMANRVIILVGGSWSYLTGLKPGSI